MNRANVPPANGRLFYVIQDREDEDDLVDVYLMPFQGVTLVVRGVVLPEGHGENDVKRRLNAVSRLAEDIRARYYAWCESADVARIGGERL